MANPLQVLGQHPGLPAALVGRGIATGQPRMPYDRAPQYGKYFAYEHEFLPLGASAVNVIKGLVIDGNTDFLLQDLAALFGNGACLATWNLSPLGENFNNVPAYLSLLLGSGQFCRPVNPPRVLRRNSTLTVTLTDDQLVPAEQNVIFAYHGTKVSRTPIIPARRYERSEPFDYVASFTAKDSDPSGTPVGPIAAGATVISSVRTDGGSDFEVQEIACVSDGPCTVQIANDQDNWFLTPLRSELFGGSPIELTTFPILFSGSRGYRLPGPRLITAAGYIQTTVSNKMAAATNRVQMAYRGQRLYPAGGLTPGR
jgi:hypothetical protein